VLRQLVELHEVASAPLEPVPPVYELAVFRGLPREPTRVVGVVPDAGLGQELIELVGSLELAGQVKDAP
jgi:hypothetical protein